jgi:hypothetical protein
VISQNFLKAPLRGAASRNPYAHAPFNHAAGPGGFKGADRRRKRSQLSMQASFNLSYDLDKAGGTRGLSGKIKSDLFPVSFCTTRCGPLTNLVLARRHFVRTYVPRVDGALDRSGF